MWKKKILHCMLSVVCAFVKMVFSLRYRVTIQGLDHVAKDCLKRGRGTLILPNHPAEMEAVLLEIMLWSRLGPRPLVVDHFFYLKGARFFMNCIGALPVPHVERTANKWKRKKIKQTLDQVVSGLEQGDHLLIYPGGRLKLTEKETIGGSSFVHDVLERCPDVNVVLIRTTGFWGSRFSRAITGQVPSFWQQLGRSVVTVLKNGIFFTPRRKVHIEMLLAPEDFPRKASRVEFNRYLESWYNRVPDSLNLVSESFWRKDLPEVTAKTPPESVEQEVPIPTDVQQEVYQQLSTLTRTPLDKLSAQTHLALDLGLDSLDLAQIYTFLEQRYGVSHLGSGSLQTIQDVLLAAAGFKEPEEELSSPNTSKPHVKWPKEPFRPVVIPAQAQTFHEAFLRVCDRMGGYSACADATIGRLSYRRLKIAALMLSAQISKMSGSHIGIMMPASVGVNLLIIAVWLAGKIPVMLNWTSGVRALDHAVSLLDLKVILSSQRFLERLEEDDLGAVEERLFLLEEIRAQMGLKEKWKAWKRSWQRTERLLSTLGLSHIDEDQVAAILFTSGTESLPKGVPLTHKNILSNQRAAAERITFVSDDIFYGAMPPFHSVGFSFTGLLPLLFGIRVYYAPDPTDSFALAADIKEQRATIFVSVPSFLREVFRVAKPEDLHSLRLLVTGAEKTPDELFDYVQFSLLGCQLLEGYGVTECSPLVTLNRPGIARCGVGFPLEGVEVSIIDVEAKRSLRQGEEGEIAVFGPNVFSGYLGQSKPPFVEIEGRRWYCCGDRGRIDEKGALILLGRLKRFVKIGGEMVSLGGLEEDLNRFSKDKQWVSRSKEGPYLAVIAKESEEAKTMIVLFTTFDLSKEEVNEALKEAGYSRLIKISEVRKMSEIPMTGTGKIHYRGLEGS